MTITPRPHHSIGPYLWCWRESLRAGCYRCADNRESPAVEFQRAGGGSIGRRARSASGHCDQGDPGVDAELVEDVAQVAVHRVRGDEQRLGDLAVSLAFRGELGDGRFGAGQSLPAGGRTVRDDDPPPYTQLSELAAYQRAPACTSIARARSSEAIASPVAPSETCNRPRSSSADAAASGRGPVSKSAAAVSRS